VATSATSFRGLKPNRLERKSVMTLVMGFWVKRPSTAVLMRIGTSAVAIASIAGCAAPATPAASPASAAAEPQTVSPSASASSPGVVPSPGNAPAPVPAPAQRRAPEIVLDPKEPLRPLPELKVENIGLHIGGGPNDAETKAPFLKAVAERFPAFMDCYRKNEDPAPGGRFGVDLHVARAGGHPRVEQPRSSLRGPDFRACLTAVFESVDFKKPKQGPTTLSYSLRFTLVEAP